MARTKTKTAAAVVALDAPAVHTETMGDLQREAILFSLKIGSWRIRKNAERAKVETTAQARLVNVRKRILDSDEYRAIAKEDTAAREFVLRQSVPSPLGRGVYLLPIELVKGTMDWLSGYQARREDLIRAFLEVYPAQQEEMRGTLGDLYDEDDYPDRDDVQGKFWVSTMLMELNAPTALKGISGLMYEEEVARIRNVWDETRETISAALYSEMAELVGTLAERLETKPGEKEQVIRGAVVEKFQEWCDLFTARNLSRDGRLEALVARGRAIVSGLEVSTIRDSKTLRKELATEFCVLRTELTAAIGARPTRKIRLMEE
jgi:hypothetical protein